MPSARSAGTRPRAAAACEGSPTAKNQATRTTAFFVHCEGRSACSQMTILFRTRPSPQSRPEPEAEDHLEGFDGDAGGDLGITVAAFGERDRDLDEAEPGHPGAVVRLQLEGIAVRFDLRDADALQRGAAENAEAAGRVPERQARDGTDDKTTELRDEAALEGPIHGDAALHVAGTDDEVRVLRGLEQGG